MAERIPIQAQIDEVEAVYLSRRASLAQRAEAISRGKTVPPDTGCVKSGQPSLAAAIRTLKLVRDNAEAFRAVLTERDEDSA